MTSTAPTSTPRRSGYRRWFLIDGVVTGANAVLYLVLNQLLPGWIGGTSALYLTVGVFLLVVTVGLLAVARSARPPAGLAWLLVIINVLWAATSFVVALVNPFGANGFGTVWTVVQGVIVLAFAILQARSLRA